MSTTPPLSLRDLDVRAARVLEFVQFFNAFIVLGIALSFTYLFLIYFDHFFLNDSAVDNIRDIIYKKNHHLPLSMKMKVTEIEMDHLTSAQSGPTTALAARTGKTSWTLGSSDLKKLIEQNIVSKLYKDEGRGFNDELCEICSKKFKSRDKIKILDCEHYFHAHCLTKQISNNGRCCFICGKDFTDLLIGPYKYNESILSLSNEEKSPSYSVKTTKTKNVTINTPGTNDFYTNYYNVDGDDDYEDEDDNGDDGKVTGKLESKRPL